MSWSCDIPIIIVVLTLASYHKLPKEGGLYTYFGSLCLGHGTRLNSCGMEYRKLRTWGMKNSIMVLLKCPRMPTTAKVIPAK